MGIFFSISFFLFYSELVHFSLVNLLTQQNTLFTPVNTFCPYQVFFFEKNVLIGKFCRVLDLLEISLINRREGIQSTVTFTQLKGNHLIFRSSGLFLSYFSLFTFRYFLGLVLASSGSTTSFPKRGKPRWAQQFQSKLYNRIMLLCYIKGDHSNVDQNLLAPMATWVKSSPLTTKPWQGESRAADRAGSTYLQPEIGPWPPKLCELQVAEGRRGVLELEPKKQFILET